jgi:hypothetical protein
MARQDDLPGDGPMEMSCCFAQPLVILGFDPDRMVAVSRLSGE